MVLKAIDVKVCSRPHIRPLGGIKQRDKVTMSGVRRIHPAT